MLFIIKVNFITVNINSLRVFKLTSGGGYIDVCQSSWGYFAIYQSCGMVNWSLYWAFKFIFLINDKGTAAETSPLTSIKILGEATIGSTTRRTTRNVTTVQARKTNDVELVHRTTMGLAVMRSTRNAATMQAGKSNNVEPIPTTSVRKILIRESSTSTRVTYQFSSLNCP